MGYTDSSYMGDIDDQKLITKQSIFLGKVITTWCNKRLQTISTSISKFEYVAMSYNTRKGIWIQKFLNKLLSKQVVRRIEIFGDNKMSFILTRDLKSQNSAKHINVMHNYIQGLVEDEELKIN